MNKKLVEVAVGVIMRDGKVFLTKRAQDVHQAGKWEFPGGKKEANESIEQALCRELHEEVGIDVSEPQHLLTIEHDYSDKSVRLVVFVAADFSNEPESKEGLLSQWVPVGDLENIDFPEANKAIVAKLNTL